MAPAPGIAREQEIGRARNGGPPGLAGLRALHPATVRDTKKPMSTLHDFKATTIDGEEQSLADFAGKAVLVVNVASKCGLTPHYTGLEALHLEMANRGLVVVGFPCNQFGSQEPGTEAEIKEFCSLTYDVSFPLFSKIEVNGAGRHPVYEFLTSQETLPEGAGDISWNFTKFVVDREGRVAARFGPVTEPDDVDLRSAIEDVL